MKSKNNIIACMDFGATYIKLALVSTKGIIIKKDFFSTKQFGSRKRLISEIIERINLLIGNRKKNILGLGCGVPGQVDYKNGMIYNLTNVKGWKRVPLRGILREVLGFPVFVDNDGNTAALGEMQWGAAKGYRNIICLTLGSGVGGGIIIDGNVYRGRAYSAGEVGHICIDKTGPKCGCGSNGCLESFVGNSYIVKDTVKRLKNKRRSIILRSAGGRFSKITPEIISNAAKKGDNLAIAIWNTVGENLGIGLSSMVNIFNPEIIVIGGGMSRAGSVLFKSMRNSLRKRAIDIFTKGLVIRKAKYLEDAGIVGAAALVKNEIG
jgi:glucokinase